MGEGILEAPNHGAVSAQIAHPVQDWEHLNGNISLSGAWNDAQTKFTVVEQMTIPALSMHFITSKSYQLDGDTLAVSDSDHVAMYNEYGVPQDDFNLVKYDCRYNKRQN
ncbi:MAG: hypothetical protein NT027_10105 [Proteobacteria bacterium]|nr:hypothetical protein [Pseudomonadota bacterium]